MYRASPLRRGFVTILLAVAPVAASLAPGRAIGAQQARLPGSGPDSVRTGAGPSDDLPATLLVHNREVAVFRDALGADGPRERAAAAGRRIARLASELGGDSISVRPVSEGRLFEVDGRRLFVLTPADADTLAGESLDEIVAATTLRLREVLRAEREQRSVRFLVRAVALATLATLLFLGFLRLLYRSHAWTDLQLASAERRLPGITARGFTILTAEQLLGSVRRLATLASWIIGLVAAYLWLTFVLTRFPYSRPWGEALGTYLVTTLSSLALGALSAIPGIFTVVVIFLITRFVARVVTGFFQAVEGGSVSVGWLHADTAQPTRRLVVALLWMFAVVMAYPYLPGSESPVFRGLTVFLGLVVSLGSTGLVNQAMSGLTLMYSRALRPGEYVRIGDVEGTVTALGVLSTKIMTPKREEVTIPNTVVIGTATKNFSRLCAECGVVLHTTVTIGYDAPWRQVQALLVEAVYRTPGLRQDPPPFVNQTSLSDFYVEYQLNAYLDRPETRMRTLSELHANIQDCFNEHGVQIMSPHYESDKREPVVVPRERWYAAPAVAGPPSTVAAPDSLGPLRPPVAGSTIRGDGGSGAPE